MRSSVMVVVDILMLFSSSRNGRADADKLIRVLQRARLHALDARLTGTQCSHAGKRSMPWADLPSLRAEGAFPMEREMRPTA